MFIGILVGIMWIVEGIVALSTLGDARVEGLVDLLRDHQHHRRYRTCCSRRSWGAAVLWWLLGIALVVLGIINIVRAFTFKGEY